MMAPDDAVNLFLFENFGLGLEDVLTLGIEKKARPQLQHRVVCGAERIDHWRDEDGAVTELFEGVLTVDGVRYAWRASVYTDLDGDRFLANIGAFAPLDWRAGLRVVR
jgi:hypothetical protein